MVHLMVLHFVCLWWRIWRVILVTGEVVKVAQVVWQVVMVVSSIAPDAKQLAIRHPLLVLHIICLANVYACRASTSQARQPWHLGGCLG